MTQPGVDQLLGRGSRMTRLITRLKQPLGHLPKLGDSRRFAFRRHLLVYAHERPPGVGIGIVVKRPLVRREFPRRHRSSFH
jgi:hypothetical protein